MTSNNTYNNNGVGDETAQSWKKFAESAEKAGFREGVEKGYSETFQNSFDKGYIEGFKNGFVISKYKGVLRAQSMQADLSNEIDSDLEHSRRGWCQMCKDNNLLQKGTLEQIKSIQAQFSNTLLENLYEKYSLKTSVSLPNKID